MRIHSLLYIKSSFPHSYQRSGLPLLLLMLESNIDKLFPLEAPKHLRLLHLHQFYEFHLLVGSLKSRRQSRCLLLMGENIFIVFDVDTSFDQILHYFVSFVFERLLDQMRKVFITFSFVFFPQEKVDPFCYLKQSQLVTFIFNLSKGAVCVLQRIELKS